MKTRYATLGALALLTLALCAANPAGAQISGLTADSPMNKLDNGGFEMMTPSYWTATGAGATWSTEQSRTPERSLKLSGAGAADWTMQEAVRNWSPRFPGNADLEFGAYVWTDGVNTNPGSDAEKYQMVLSFRNADGTDLLGGELALDLPQADASTGGWTRITTADLGALTLSEDATSATITIRKGASATGTVYVDDFFIKSNSEGVWPGDIFNANVDAGGGWYYWWDCFPCGSADWPENQPFINTVSADAAHSGSYGVKLQQNTADASETVHTSQRVPVTEGEPVLVSFWLRHAGNEDPTTIGEGDNNLGMTALWYSSLESGAAGYNEIGGADVRLNGEYNTQVIPRLVQEADGGWKQYAFVFNPVEGAVGMEVRMRYWHSFTGEAHYDELFDGDVSDVMGELPNLLANGDFEMMTPSYWTATGAGATWSTEQSRTPERSLKLSGAGAADWTMQEAVRNWSPRFPGNADLEFGAYVWTDGVNTNPGSDAEKYQMVLSFRNADGTDLLGGELALDLPQADASTGGWTRITTADLGALTLSEDATSATITIRKGASATGTVYVDDFFIKSNSEGVWPGDIFNANVDAGGGWYYWWDCFPCGSADWPENQPFINTVSADAAHSGSYGVKLQQNTADASETVHTSQRVPVTEGEPVLVSFWLRHAGNEDPTTIGEGDNNLGMTALWYSSLESGAAGYNEIGGADVRLNGEYNTQVIPRLVQEADGGWKQYAFVFNPVEGAVGMEVRMRYWHSFTGQAHYDDVSITNLGSTRLVSTDIDTPDDETPSETRLRGNYPNPFTASTMIGFDLDASSAVTLEVFDVLGRRVATLLDGEVMPAGAQSARFDATALPSGTYVYVLRAGSRMEARTMVLLR